MKTDIFAFGRSNYIFLVLGIAVIVLGFVLMSGEGSTEEAFIGNIFSDVRIKIAPIVCLVGYFLIGLSIFVTRKTN